MPITKEILTQALLALIGLFAVSLVLRRRWPRIYWLTALLSLFLLGQGWLMTFNPTLVYDSMVFYFHHVQQPISWLPGTVDHETSLHQMLLITGLFGAFWVAMDTAANPVWRDRLWLVISATGVSLTALGLLQRVTGAPGIFWRSDLDCGPTFFATYRYHANAGAFINIGLLFVAARMICMFRGDHSDLVRSFWVLAFLGTLVSAFVNVSRVATLIGVVLLCVFFCWELREGVHAKKVVFYRRRIATITIAGVMAAGFLIWAVGFKDAYLHWAEVGKSLVSDDRVVVYGAIVHYVLPASGFWGFGPGTFHLIFPFFTNSLGMRIEGYWEYAHEDYLETLVEWGFYGAAAWFLLFGQTVVRAGWRFWRGRRNWDSNARRFAVACFLALGAILIHATVDFPMQIASLQLYTAVLLGLLAAGPGWDKGGRAGSKGRLKLQDVLKLISMNRWRPNGETER